MLQAAALAMVAWIAWRPWRYERAQAKDKWHQEKSQKKAGRIQTSHDGNTTRDTPKDHQMSQELPEARRENERSCEEHQEI